MSDLNSNVDKLLLMNQVSGVLKTSLAFCVLTVVCPSGVDCCGVKIGDAMVRI